MKPYIDLHPGREADEALRAWQGCPTIAATRGGRLFAGWYTGGALEPCIDNFNVLVRSDDGGKNWSAPILTVKTDTENRMRNIDIQLWVDPDNRLWVMWTRSPYPENAPRATLRTPFNCNYHNDFIGVEAMICSDPDADILKWEEPRVIIAPGFLRCKPVVLSDGTWVFPAYDWAHEDRYFLHFSADKGLTFRDVAASKKMSGNTFDETMLYEAPDRLRYLVRTKEGCIGYSDSFDGGQTWTPTAAYQPATASRFYIARLASGALLMVRNASETSRTGMVAMLSDDHGETWPYRLLLDGRTNVSYPDVCERNGRLFIVHDRERDNRHGLNRETWQSSAAKEILLSDITEADIRRGSIGGDSYAAHVISKGGMNYVEK